VVVELRHLRYFVAAGEEEHFGRPAGRLHVVQPALTRQVRPLEEEMGCLLFERLDGGEELPSILRRFRAGWPDVRLELSSSTSISAVEQLRNREVDVAFVYTPE
jgi:DNA-binding transcriptional LysR family regulator